MKLYTRDQMIEAMRFVFMHDTDETPVEFIDTLTPIELPSEEEIDEESKKDSWMTYEFEQGAKWVIEQIKQQDK